jgi:hypothetical protein
MLAILQGSLAAEYDSCTRPNGVWAGFDQGLGQSYGYAGKYTNGNLYIGGRAHGDLSFASNHATNGYSDHQGTQATHDAHTDVTIHHATGSFGDPLDSSNDDPLTSQHGMDSIIYKIDTAGVPKMVYAVDTMPIDGVTNGSSINGRWGGYSFFYGLDDFAGEPDMLAAVGSFRGSLKFPRAAGGHLEITNGKNGQWDAFVSKIDMGTGDIKWATNEGITVADGRGYGRTVATTSAGHVITATDRRPSRSYIGQMVKFDGATGVVAWSKVFSDLYWNYMKMSKADETVYVTGRIEGYQSKDFAPLPAMTSCENGTDNSAFVAAMDTSGADGPVPQWAVNIGCGYGYATTVQGAHLYVSGDLDSATTIGTCSLTGAYGGFLLKLNRADGTCVWAKDTPFIRRLNADANHVWAITSDDDPVDFSATHSLIPGGYDMFLSKYQASDGVGLWASTLGGSGSEYAYDMEMTPSGPVAIGYSTGETFSLGSVTVNNLQHKATEAPADVPDTDNAGSRAMFAVQVDKTDGLPSCVESCTGEIANAVVKPNFCYVDDICIAHQAMSPKRSCFKCDASTPAGQKDLGEPITTNHCYFAVRGDRKTCVNKGTMAPAYQRYNDASVCETCDPAVSASGWSVQSGFFHDRTFASEENRRGDGKANNYGIFFEQGSAGCQVLPTVPMPNGAAAITVAAALANPTDTSIGAIGTRITNAFAALDGATATNQDAVTAANQVQVAAAWYHANPAGDCAKAADNCASGTAADGTACVHSDVCDHTPASHADAMGVPFETNLHYGHSIARVKVLQALAILHNDLATGTTTAPAADLIMDIKAHMLIPMYQGAIGAAYKMDRGASSAQKAAGMDDLKAYWTIIKGKVTFPANEVARLDAMSDSATATAQRGDGFYCQVKAILHRKLPDGSALQYRGDHGNSGLSALSTSTSRDEGSNAHVSAEDIGNHKDAVDSQNDPICAAYVHASPAPPPAADKKEAATPETKSAQSASSGLSEGEIAGVAVGAAVGGIVVLVAIGLLLRSLLVRDAKPVFTCLEKAPADKKGPPV